MEPANASDANALLPYIETVKQREIAPKELLADSLYGSDSNHEKAGKEEIDLIAPTMGNRKDALCTLSDFTLAGNGAFIACPHGHQPVMAKKKKNRFVSG